MVNLGSFHHKSVTIHHSPLYRQIQPAILGAPALGSFYNALPNKDLTWEITSMTNVGVDLGLFSNKGDVFR
jgi:hypothetical protein